MFRIRLNTTCFHGNFVIKLVRLYAFVKSVKALLISQTSHQHVCRSQVGQGYHITHVSLVEQELFTLPEHMTSPRFLVVFMFLNLYFSVQCFVDHCRFTLSSDLTVLITTLISSIFYFVLRFNGSDYPFDIFNLLLCPPI